MAHQSDPPKWAKTAVTDIDHMTLHAFRYMYMHVDRKMAHSKKVK